MFRRAVPVVTVLLLAGCNGGTVDRHALTRDSETLDSIACEGALVADGVASGRTTMLFAREQAEELAIQASNLADSLARRPAVPSIEQRVRDKSKHAAALARALWRLHDDPGDRAAGAKIEAQLQRAGSCP